MMCWSKSVGVFVVGLLAVGCATTPPPDRSSESGVGAPAVWSGAPANPAEPDTAWVHRFASPTLNALVAEAMAANPDLKITAARLDQARAMARSVRAERGPALDANLSGSKRKQNFLGFPFGAQSGGTGESSVLSSKFDSFDASLDIRWEMDLWGRIRAGESGALANVQAAEAEVLAARASLAAEVCKAWFNLAEAEEQLRLAGETVTITAETTRVIRERFESGQANGRGTGTDLRLAMSEESTARADVESVRRLRDVALRRLELSLGRYPSATVQARAELPDPGEPPPAGLPAGLVRRRPDVVAAERRFAAQGARAKEARLAVFPNLTLTGSTGYATDSLKEILNSDFGVWSLAGGIVQPIFYSGQIRAEKDKRTAEEREAQAVLQKTVLGAFGEVEKALAAESMLAARFRHLVEAERLATEADAQARADYREGRGDALTVFSAQSRLIQTRRQLATARLIRLENRVDLHLALGGDFRS